MRKSMYLLLVVLITTGCARDYYAPRNVNQFGIQTQVVLDRANYRIVRNVDIVLEVDNSNLQLMDVEKSAYAKLLREANLTGSQALINVVIEEIRREKTNIFRRYFSGLVKVKQYVAARGTIIEFLDANGQPIPSQSAPSIEKSDDNRQITEESKNTPQSLEQMNLPDEWKRAEMAKKEENKAYVALLIKTNKLDSKYKNEISSIFQFEEIVQFIQSKTIDELRTMAKKHSKCFDKYEIYE